MRGNDEAVDIMINLKPKEENLGVKDISPFVGYPDLN